MSCSLSTSRGDRNLSNQPCEALNVERDVTEGSQLTNQMTPHNGHYLSQLNGSPLRNTRFSVQEELTLLKRTNPHSADTNLEKPEGHLINLPFWQLFTPAVQGVC